MRAIFKAFLLLPALTLSCAAAADLPRPVLRELRAAGIPRESVGVVVQEVAAPRPSLAINASQSMNPASVMKLVTTYAALELLTPAYRWKTEVYFDGEQRDDTLVGNLVLRGSGDPKLNYESFWMLLRALRGRGLREIRGDVVLDRSYFEPAPDLPFDSDSYRPYNVPPDALLVNFKALRFTFIPEPERGTVRVFAEPALPGLQLVNSLKITDGNCPEGRAFRDLMQAAFNPVPPRAAFTGLYPLACGEREMNVALHHPEDYVAGMIRQLWAEMGGTWTGYARDGTLPPAARLAYVHESEPLGEIVRDINKFSNNVMARQLYLTLAAELGGAPATGEKAGRAIAQWLLLKNIPAQELVLENGSGLSRIERASPRTLAALLLAAWKSPVMPEFVASLPVVAIDGTMRKRMRGDWVAGHAHIKTGLLVDARAIGGYVLDRGGRRHAVVMIVNHPNAPQADAAFDAFLSWAYEGRSATGPARATSSPPDVSPPRP